MTPFFIVLWACFIIMIITASVSISLVFAQVNGTAGNTTSQNFSMAQNAGNKLFNQLMCNKDPSYCPGGMNAPP